MARLSQIKTGGGVTMKFLNFMKTEEKLSLDFHQNLSLLWNLKHDVKRYANTPSMFSAI